MNTRNAVKKLRRAGYEARRVDDAHICIYRPGDPTPLVRLPQTGNRQAKNLKKTYRYAIEKLLATAAKKEEAA